MRTDHILSVIKMIEIKDELTRNWLSSVGESSARQYYYRFNAFLEYFDITPAEFLEEAQHDKITIKNRLNAWYNYLKNDKGYSYNSAAMSEATVKSFLQYYEVDLPKLPSRPRTTEHEREPLRKEEIKKLVVAAPHLRDKALIVMGFQTGMSISDLLRLNYKDVKEAVENKTVHHHIIKYRRRKEATKGFAIIGNDSIKLQRQYIDWRKEQGEKLTSKSPLFIGLHKKNKIKRFSVRGAQYMMRETIVKAQLSTFEELKSYGTFNPYGFHAIRTAFSSIAEQFMPKTCVDYSMAHKLPYNGAYTKYKDEERIELFKAAEPHLSISLDTREFEEKAKEHDETIEVLKSQLVTRDEELEALKYNMATELEEIKDQQKMMMSGDLIERTAKMVLNKFFEGIFETTGTETGLPDDDPLSLKLKTLKERIEKDMQKNIEEMEELIETVQTKE